MRSAQRQIAAIGRTYAEAMRVAMHPPPPPRPGRAWGLVARVALAFAGLAALLAVVAGLTLAAGPEVGSAVGAIAGLAYGSATYTFLSERA